VGSRSYRPVLPALCRDEGTSSKGRRPPCLNVARPVFAGARPFGRSQTPGARQVDVSHSLPPLGCAWKEVFVNRAASVDSEDSGSSPRFLSDLSSL
jgi:hypothetical protein